MTDGDGILRAKSSYVTSAANLLLIGIYLEGPIDHFLNSWLPATLPSLLRRQIATDYDLNVRPIGISPERAGRR